MEAPSRPRRTEGKRVGHAEVVAANRANWDDRVPIHERYYGDLLALRADPRAVTSTVLRDLPTLAVLLQLDPDGPLPLAGLRVAHLQCHLGTDTVALAHAGASVIGLDFSAPALEVAARLARDCGVDIRWVRSDVLDAAGAIGEPVDVVYTSVGTIWWFQDLGRWARQIALLLQPGGLVYFRDWHPALAALDDSAAGALRLAHRYFENGSAQERIETTTYTGGDERLAHPRTYEWPHSVAEIVAAMLGAGLRLVLLEEGMTLEWRAHPHMVQVQGGFALPTAERHLVPVSLTVAAVRD